MTLEKDPGHRHHRLSRRRQDDADPPSAAECRGTAASRSSSTSSAMSASMARSSKPAATRSAARTTSSSSPMAASAAPWPTISSRPWRSCSTATEPPEHIVIETSGLALPQPLVRAFNWPEIKSRVTVDGVVTVVDAKALAEGRFADDEEAVAAQRAADPNLDHDNPIEELFEDQLNCADHGHPQQDRPAVDARDRRARRRPAEARCAPARKLVPARKGALDVRHPARPRRRRPRTISPTACRITSWKARSTTTTTSTASSCRSAQSLTATRSSARIKQLIARPRHPADQGLRRDRRARRARLLCRRSARGSTAISTGPGSPAKSARTDSW